MSAAAIAHQIDDEQGGSPEDFARFIKSETERWARVIHAMDAAKPKTGSAAHP